MHPVCKFQKNLKLKYVFSLSRNVASEFRLNNILFSKKVIQIKKMLTNLKILRIIISVF